MTDLPRVVVVTGPVGAGKTTTAEAFREVLLERGESGAVIDVDALRNAWPAPEDDPFGERLGRANLAAIWPNLVERGFDWLVLADVVETADHRLAYEQAFPGAEITIARLDVPIEVIMKRLIGRETDDTIAWYLKRAPELQQIMITNDIGDLVIAITDESPRSAAERILSAVTCRA
ncbi:MAG: zeta toxin family protein [Microlunatus sp.]|nr:zeta toxin family protein [Microlunatus sp.]